MSVAPALPPRLATASVLVGLFAALASVGGSPGVGVPLTALAIAGVLCFSGGWKRRSRDAAVLGGLGLTLVGMAAVRDAEWLVGIDVLAALALGVWAVTGLDSWSSLVGGLESAAIASFAAPSNIAGSLAGQLDHSRRQRLGPLLRGSLVGLMLVLVFGTLFVTADSAFAQIAGELFERDWDARLWPARAVVAVVVAGLAGGLLSLQRTGTVVRTGARDVGAIDPFGPRIALRLKERARSEWLVPLALLDLLFAAFVFVQITVLFGGRDHVLSEVGVTYAEYARSGFFQLLAVAFLTLIVIAIGVNAAQPTTLRDKQLLQVLLGFLCLCTLVILVSAFMRLHLYEETYGFTRLRVAVHATILWLAALFALVGAAGIRMKAAWLPRSVIVLTATALIAFSLVDPDRFIAQQNIRRYELTGKIDVEYLSSLSADAVPALVELPDDKLGCLLEVFEYRMSFDEPVMSANLSRARARSLLQREGAQPEDCAP